MEQTAIVKRVLSNGLAEVSLIRRAECGLKCESCGSCSQRPKEGLSVLADNALGAEVGAVVTVRPNCGNALWAAGLIFLLPCIGMIVGYMLAQWFGGSQTVCIAAAFLCAGIGFVPALVANRAATKQNRPEFTILSLRR